MTWNHATHARLARSACLLLADALQLVIPDLALHINIDKEVAIKHVLGQGAHGTVHYGVYNDKPVAVKKFPMDDNIDIFAEELDVLCRIDDAHVVKLLGAGYTQHHLYLILELCDTSLDK